MMKLPDPRPVKVWPERRVVADPLIPPSRFGAGYTAGAQAPPGQVAVGPQGATMPGPFSAVAHRRDPTQGADSGWSQDPAKTAAASVSAGVNVLAAVSFVLTLLWGPFLALATIPMALRARTQIAQRHQSGGGLALSALVLGVIYLAVGVVVVALALCTQGPLGAGWR
jgi:hypothetical protein